MSLATESMSFHASNIATTEQFIVDSKRRGLFLKRPGREKGLFSTEYIQKNSNSNRPNEFLDNSIIWIKNNKIEKSNLLLTVKSFPQEQSFNKCEKS